MWSFVMPALCVLAHLLVIVLFLPAFWREMDERGYGWHYTITLYLVPLMTIALVVSRVLSHGGPTWFLAAAFFTVDGMLMVVVLTTVGLLARRRRAASAG